jgi:hypothetical protein
MELSASADLSKSPPSFKNSDGSAATWVEPIPLEARRKAFAKRFIPGLLVALLLWGAQYSNGVLAQDYLIVGLIPLVIGALVGMNAYQKTEVRLYSTAKVEYTTQQRVKRARGYWLLGIGTLAVIWGLQLGYGQFEGYWWYAWPALFPLFVGTGLYLLRGEVALAPAAAEAKKHFDAETQKLVDSGKAPPTAVDKLLTSGWFRYPCAAALLYGAYYFAVEDTGKNSGWVALACVVLAGMCAYEVSKPVLYVGLVVGIGWAAISGLAALPVSLAIIIGALIIASAVRK